MPDASSLHADHRPLYVAAGICSFVAMAANLSDVILGFGDTAVVTYGTRSAREWIESFQHDAFHGLYALGILNIVYMTSMLPIYFAMRTVHRQTHPLASLIALTLSAIALSIYVSGNAAVPMMVIAERYATAVGPPERAALVAAGEALLARGEDFTPGAFPGLFASGVAALLMAWIMLRGGVFSRSNAWVGLVGFTLLTVFTIIATFVPAWYFFAFYVFGGLGGMLALAWFAMTGVRFFTLR